MIRLTAFLVALAAFLLPGFASAGVKTERVKTEYATSWFEAEKARVAPGETLWVAFAQELADGWHVYWKNPGDSGLPLMFAWDLPAGVSAGEIVYPTPERIVIGPLANFGHHGAPVFLTPLSIPDDAAPGAELSISVKAVWLICEEICVPEEAGFSFRLTVASVDDGKAEAVSVSPIFAQARAALSRPMSGQARFTAEPEALYLSAPALEGLDGDVFFFPDAEGLIEPSAAQQTIRKDGRILIKATPGYRYEPAQLADLTGVLASNSDHPVGYRLTAAIAEAPLSAQFPAAPVRQIHSTGNLWLLVVAALFGGALLNLMPCVFPILFVKAASLISLAHGHDAGDARSAARRHGAVFAVGVVLSFTLLGGTLLALRAGGEQLGWGFHLQSPAVVGLSAYVLFLVGLNLAGVFEIGESLQGLGDGLAARSGDLGAFFTGVLTVTVAAPCIGPLLSAPMGAAVFLPPMIGVMIFVLMGIGLAAPYACLCFAPGLAQMLPRPGPWTVIFKQALAFPVFAAAAYFLWVLAQQTAGAGLALVLGGAVVLAAAAWGFQLSKNMSTRGRLVRIVALLFAGLALAPLLLISSADNSQAAGAVAGGGYGEVTPQAFAPAEIETIRTSGRGVFVDFTAAWCVTCQFNKLTIFSRPAFSKAVEAGDVQVMVADWTTRDPVITDALSALGASGVPLYVYYPPTGEPVVLDLPLREKALIAALSSKP